MNTNNSIRILILFLLATTFFYGQNRPIRDKIKTLKVAFITERLSLTSEEAQVFWPIYNEHEDKIEAIKRKERREIRAKLVNFDELSEKQADALLNDLIALENEKHQLNVDFMEKMSKAITSKKTFLLIKAEEDFKKRLLKEMRDRRRGGG
ncbi:hypothetical protein [Ulvibacterium marinum]|uniref:hypothetical protein n=1 Tax=Ulvibacterium marinum TaxID=2419782 RepID=UPI002494627F|nr:hypothetical protein [Ulvibacterium marinum]